MKKKIVFYGGGNMAEGIMRCLLNNAVVAPEQVTVNELIPARCEYLTKTYGVDALTSAVGAIKDADLVIVAVNPHQLPSVAEVLKPLLNERTVIISIVAATTIATLQNLLGGNRKVVRVTPNTLNQAGYGYSAVCIDNHCDDSDKASIKEILNALGQVMHLSEDMFNAFTSFSNAGPLWLYKAVEALTDAGVHVGFRRADARNIVLMNMLGVATILDKTGEHPAVKVDQMTSPGGVTIEALKSLQNEGFAASIMNSVSAGFDKVNSLE